MRERVPWTHPTLDSTGELSIQYHIRNVGDVQPSRSAEIELKRLTTFCEKLNLSVTKIRKIKRIVRIMFEGDGKSAASR